MIVKATLNAIKRFWPIIFIAAGLSLLLGGFTYDLTFAGIPYQDPTPEMSARFDFHKRIAITIYLSGVGSFLLGALAGISRWVVRRFRPPVD